MPGACHPVQLSSRGVHWLPLSLHAQGASRPLSWRRCSRPRPALPHAGCSNTPWPWPNRAQLASIVGQQVDPAASAPRHDQLVLLRMSCLVGTCTAPGVVLLAASGCTCEALSRHSLGARTLSRYTAMLRHLAAPGCWPRWLVRVVVVQRVVGTQGTRHTSAFPPPK
jgi:hypothetical protein